ncbi:MULTISPECIES: DUF1289 domain-containing protein [Microbulbifer]|uniref:DUF1289 domain-containing protein n=1 Tax=Microbulbifer TaxID=48073 RepID=UPI001E345FEE|nr:MULTISPECIES: DUF1289 domain-containing protein [Microbulbifer]UHQ56168.1 DUF1289 domain-containing protein [Microbulbifer sp. YPW16]
MTVKVQNPVSTATPAAGKPVKSPCISVCALNAEDICEGCFRTGTEISRWGNMNNDERRSVLQRCTERARQMGRLW